jgi:hypothetical protein
MFLNKKTTTITNLVNAMLEEMFAYNYVPTNYVGNTNVETGVDENGNTWKKTTFTSNDGSYTQTSYTTTNSNTWNPTLDFSVAFDTATNAWNTNTTNNTTSTKAGKSYADRLELLKTELNTAVENQKFEEAARIKKEIDTYLVNNSEYKTLKNELSTLVANYNFEKAIEVRDRIKQLETEHTYNTTTNTTTTNTTTNKTTKTTK